MLLSFNCCWRTSGPWLKMVSWQSLWENEAYLWTFEVSHYFFKDLAWPVVSSQCFIILVGKFVCIVMFHFCRRNFQALGRRFFLACVTDSAGYVSLVRTIKPIFDVEIIWRFWTYYVKNRCFIQYNKWTQPHLQGWLPCLLGMCLWKRGISKSLSSILTF